MSDEITGRSLTFVEADVDVYRITRFEAARAGAPLDGWSLIEGVNTSLTGVIDAALPSGRGARLQKTVANGDAVWRWAAMPSALDVSVVALLRSQIAAEDAAIVLRNAAPGWGYLLRLANNVLEIRKGVGAGSYALLAALAFDVVANDSVWLRFDAAAVTGPGVLLRGKVWRGALTDEPQAFAVVHTDSVAPIAAPGPVGLYTFTAGSDVLCGHFRAKSLLGSAVETLRFAKPADYLPREISAVPDLVEASLSPGSIALGESLGERATLSVVLKDHPGADLGELFGAGTH